MIEWKDITPIFKEEPLYLKLNYWGMYTLISYLRTDFEGTVWCYPTLEPEIVAKVMPQRVNLSCGPSEKF